MNNEVGHHSEGDIQVFLPYGDPAFSTYYDIKVTEQTNVKVMDLHQKLLKHVIIL